MDKLSKPINGTLKIGDREIGEGNPCFVIAEIGINFNGELALAKASIDAAADSGADAVKFQTFHAEEFVADRSLLYSYNDAEGRSIVESQFDMFKRLELPMAWHAELRDYAARKSVVWFSSVADRAAVDLLLEVKAPVLKLASEDLINVALLEYVATKRHPVILSTGMANQQEIDQAVKIFEERECRELAILHCVSSYPTEPNQANLRRIVGLKARYPYQIGYSDHTLGIDAAICAVALGACILEKHFTLDRSLAGPDHSMSCDPKEFERLVQSVRSTESMLGNSRITYSPVEEYGRCAFRRSIVAKLPIAQGVEITEDLLAYKRPGAGLKPYERDLLLGKKALRFIPQNTQILMIDVGD